jgi:hypothetical protein
MGEMAVRAFTIIIISDNYYSLYVVPWLHVKVFHCNFEIGFQKKNILSRYEKVDFVKNDLFSRTST